MTKQIYDVEHNGNCALLAMSKSLTSKIITHQLDNTLDLPIYAELIDSIYQDLNLSLPKDRSNNRELFLDSLNHTDFKTHQQIVAKALRQLLLKNIQTFEFDDLYITFKAVLTNRIAQELNIQLDNSFIDEDIFCNMEAVEKLMKEFIELNKTKIEKGMIHQELSLTLFNLQNYLTKQHDLTINQLFNDIVIDAYKSYLAMPSTLLGHIELALLAKLFNVGLTVYKGSIETINHAFQTNNKPMAWNLVEKNHAESVVELNHDANHWTVVLSKNENEALSQNFRSNQSADEKIPTMQDANVLVNNAVSDIFDALLKWADNCAVRNQAVPQIFESVFNTTVAQYQVFEKAQPQEKFTLFENYKKLRNQAVNLIQPSAGEENESIDDLVHSLNNLLKPSL